MQRTDSATRLNVHFRVLVLDGFYVRGATNNALVFHALPTPSMLVGALTDDSQSGSAAGISRAYSCLSLATSFVQPERRLRDHAGSGRGVSTIKSACGWLRRLVLGPP